jgi:hypothetical protein
VKLLIASMRVTKNPGIATALGNFGDPRTVQLLLVKLVAIQQPRPEKVNERRWRVIYLYYLIRARQVGRCTSSTATGVDR